eukprot:CAMPEP_0171107396 /NCGR_PEP_ID=MMETSP0766_2-20121228/66712_1 /TAXON_ID=439317 /ORGANISM="Gambierdiscus australes, Strain CAWD 149" /LENGTH=101 /DNA_ID=CAMNT_0011568687 /DNA_START=15 /DNA_END=320 /DNA_ORIENTATION=-
MSTHASGSAASDNASRGCRCRFSTIARATSGGITGSGGSSVTDLPTAVELLDCRSMLALKEPFVSGHVPEAQTSDEGSAAAATTARTTAKWPNISEATKAL